MDLCISLVWLAILCGKNFDVVHYGQTFLPIFFFFFFCLPAVLIGTINFYHFIPLSVTLTLAGGHKVSNKQNLLVAISSTLFNCSG